MNSNAFNYNAPTPKAQPVNITDFTYHQPTGSLISDITDLNAHAIGKLYDDAADIGIVIVGKHSTERFMLDEIVRDADGDVVEWRFRPVKREMQITVRIVND